MQEQQNETIPKKRGRKPKSELVNLPITHQSTLNNSDNDDNNDNNEELELLKSQLQQLQEENLKLKQIAETVTITNTKNLIECTDDEINSLYVNYITTHETAHDNALVVETDGKVIIPKSYYVVG